MLEHFDSVVILATRHQGGSNVTTEVVRMGGNVYANLGLARSWLLEMDKHSSNGPQSDDE